MSLHLKTNETITAHKLRTRQSAIEKVCILGTHWAGGSRDVDRIHLLKKGRPTTNGKRLPHQKLRLYVEDSKSCERGMMNDMRQDHTLACQEEAHGDRGYTTGFDRCGTADLERVAPQRTSEWKDGPGNTKYNITRIDVGATHPGKGRAAMAGNHHPTTDGCHKRARWGGCASLKKQQTQGREVGPGTVKPINCELDGRDWAGQMSGAPQLGPRSWLKPGVANSTRHWLC